MKDNKNVTNEREPETDQDLIWSLTRWTIYRDGWEEEWVDGGRRGRGEKRWKYRKYGGGV